MLFSSMFLEIGDHEIYCNKDDWMVSSYADTSTDSKCGLNAVLNARLLTWLAATVKILIGGANALDKTGSLDFMWLN